MKMQTVEKTFDDIFSGLIVKIENQTTKKFGTGFFVGENVICTAKHTLLDYDTQNSINVIQSLNDRSVYYQIGKVRISATYDIAFIVLKKSNRSDWISFEDDMMLKKGGEYNAFCFTNKYNKHGELISLSSIGKHRGDADEELIVFSGDKVKPGMSGAAIVNTETMLATGMLAVSRDINTPAGGRGIPASIIQREFYNLLPQKFFYSLCIRNNYISETLLDELMERNRAIVVRIVKDFHVHHKPLSAYKAIIPFIQYYFERKGVSIEGDYLALVSWMCQNTLDDDIRYLGGVLNKNKKSIPSTELVKISECLKTRIVPFSKDIEQNVERYCHRKKEVLIAGSSFLRENYLHEDKGLLVPFVWQDLEEFSDDIDICSHILTGFMTGKTTKYLVRANPGMGKTTLMNSMFYKFYKFRSRCEVKYIPVYVNLSEEIYTEGVGDKDWIIKKSAEIYGTTIINYFSRLCEEIVLILDSLDEYLAGCDKQDLKRFVDSFMFTAPINIILSCRTQFYDQYLQFNECIRRFSILQLEPWKEENRLTYIYEYLSLLSQKRRKNLFTSNEQADIIGKIRRSVYLSDLSKTPLYLNMTLEIFADVLITGKRPPMITNLVELYALFVDFWLDYENGKPTLAFEKIWNILTPLLIKDLLSRIAWFYYDDAFYSRYDYIYYAQQSIEDFLSTLLSEDKWSYYLTSLDIRLLSNFLINRTFLISGRRIAFTHKSFQEYFVSEYLFSLQIDENKSEMLIKSFEKLLTPEVSEFLKGQQKKIEYSIAKKRQSFGVFKKALETNVENRVARQQLIYNTGLLHIEESTEYLKHLLNKEEDLWVKRGIIIGLSFSGDESELNKYIERMYLEREKGGETPENDVNIGFSLTFFGDQPYDNLYPEKDQHLPNCKNTITRIIYQLSTEIDRPSWRTNLYTLVDLYYYRQVSYDEYIHTMKSLKVTLLEILERMQQFDPVVSQWKETESLKLILNQL